MTEDVLKRTLERERKARADAERLLESKSRDLYKSNQALRVHQEGLKDLVNERTAQLNEKIAELNHLQARLRRDRDDARAESEAKTLLFAKLSHEIRTPLNGIIGTLNLLPSTLDTEERDRLVALASQSSRSLKAILGNVIDFAKLEQGLTELEASAFSLQTLMVDIVEMQRVSGLCEGQTLDYVLASPLNYQVIGDAGRIRQILDNFITNAVKYGGPGQIRLSLDVQVQNKLADIVLTVSDGGMPLKAEAAKQIFEPYARLVDGGDRKVGDGAGLGLAICREIADLMGADIKCHPDQRRGNHFSLSMTLPLGASLDGEASVPYVGPDRRSHNRLPDKKRSEALSALVVEDVPTNQLVLGRYLEALNFRVDYAANGLEAIEMTDLSVFDLIFMDIAMPEMDGLEATRRIRREGPNRTTPIIGVSAHTSPEDIQDMLMAGMTESLPKPIDRRKFEYVVSDMIERSLAMPTQDHDGIPDDIKKIYRRDSNAAISAFETGLKKGDRTAAKAALHQLKSLFGTFGHDSFEMVKYHHDHFEALNNTELDALAEQLTGQLKAH